MRIIIALFIGLILSQIADTAYPYGTDAHREIVIEAAKTWNEIPSEIINKLDRSRSDRECWANYDIGVDNIFTGSVEEDHELTVVRCTLIENTENDGLNGFMEHFWDPDYPRFTPSGNEQRGYNCDDENKILYNLGLPNIITFPFHACGEHFDSAYQLAQHYWDEKVIPLYLSLKRDEAYYWLGRVAHLLADQTVPAHVHLTPHDPLVGQKDLYENYVTDRKVRGYPGTQFLGINFNRECISNWKDLHPLPTDLFKLFFCTAQMTQYWASKSLKRDDFVSVGNGFYVDLNEEPHQFNPSLWEGLETPISDPSKLRGSKKEVNAVLKLMSEALLRNAYLATADLYKLFWITTHPACNDTLDNDGDAKIDYPEDPGCTSSFDPSEAGNIPPEINNLSANPSSVFFSIGTCAVPEERQSTVSVSASDADGDLLTYNWVASVGILSGSSGPENKIWTAPSGAGNSVITVTVTDPTGASASKQVSITYASEGCFSEK